MNFPSRLKGFDGWYWEALCLLAYFLLAASQLFVRPIVGVADNGDFPKVLGPRSICDPNGGRDSFEYVAPRYVIYLPCRWDPELPSTESIFVRAVKLAARWSGKDSFGIQAVGKAHLSVMLLALMVLLWGLHKAPPAIRFGLPPLVLLIFSDVAYVSYLNSFYMDAASMVFLLLTVALAGVWVVRPRVWVAIAFGVAGTLLALSKTQHAITAFFLAGGAAVYAWEAFRPGGAGKRLAWCWAVSAAAVAMAASVIIGLTPRGYKAEPLYSLIFFRMAPELPDRGKALAQLGLPESDLKYFGTHAYSSGAAVADLDWRIAFINRITYTRLAGFYLKNPRVTMHLVDLGVRTEMPGLRPGEFGNYLRKDGFPPRAQSQHFAVWSNLRSWFMGIFPAHILVLYGLMGLGSAACLLSRERAARWPLYPIVMALAASGVVEFLFPVLLDGTETSRHLFLFHVITEVLIVCAAAGALGRLSRAIVRNHAH